MSEVPTARVGPRAQSSSSARTGPVNAGAAVSAASAPAGSPAAELHAFFVTMLADGCGLVGGVAGLVYLAGSAGRNPGIAAVYAPTGDVRALPPAAVRFANLPSDPALLGRLERVAQVAAADARGVVEALSLGSDSGLYTAEPTHRLLGYPLSAAEQVHGAAVVVLPIQTGVTAADALDRLKLAGQAYEAFLWRQQCTNEAHAKTRLRETLELLDAAQRGGDAETMGAIFCHELAQRFGCSRVSIGLVDRSGRLRLAAVNSADDVDRRGAATGALEATMEECADQDAEILFPPPAELEHDPSQRRITRAHAELSGRFGPSAVISLPLRVDGDLVGVAVLEREINDPFPLGAIPLLRLIAEYIGPAMWTRRLADRGVLAVMRDRTVEIAALTLGPRYTGVKLLCASLVVLIAAMCLVPLPGRVFAESETRATVSRVIPAPFEGYLRSVDVKPGEAVREGAVLASMDLRDLERDISRVEAEIDKLQTQQADARAKGIPGDVQIYAAAIREKQEHLRLLTDRAQRGQIRAPMDGVISRGDVEPLAGARVDPTQPLFEIIGIGSVVAMVDVDERDIGRISEGGRGWISLAARPDDRYEVRITRIRPAGEPVRGTTVYKVEAELIEPPDWMKPGMTGTARLETASTTAMAMLLRPLMDRLRLYLWW